MLAIDTLSWIFPDADESFQKWKKPGPELIALSDWEKQVLQAEDISSEYS